ncbi:recombinase family protein [Persicobacter diffluens]|uniref:Resolvase n=1 Tax=Persicobacter diffluens TaxID=981 RepID=A0AAN4W4F6_9BACT|nr:resolvase [Persicobacter diffluens]
MKAIYIRVSTEGQNIAIQKGEGKEFIDKCSGTIPFFERPAVKKLTRAIEAGKISELEVTRLDRFGRKAEDVKQAINWFGRRKVQVIIKNQGLVCFNDRWSLTPATRMIIGVLAEFAEFEREVIKEKTLAGIALAKVEGKFKGRKPGSKNIRKHHQYDSVMAHLESGKSVTQIHRLTGVSRVSIAKWRDQGKSS